MASNDGYFPDGSVLRMVQRERVVGLTYGQRALGIGAIVPRNFVGTRLHTRPSDLERPFTRLVVTGKMFEEIFFGSRADADRVLAAVHRMHDRVQGELPEDQGATPAGTPYSALDAGQMLWTVAVMADSAAHFFQLFVRPLNAAELDAFWADYVRFAELFGMPASAAPGSWGEFREYFDAIVEGPEAYLSDEARFVGRAVMLEIPTGRIEWGPMRIHNVVMRGSLPPRVRELYGLGWNAADAAVSRAAITAARAARPFTPGSILRGRCTRFFDDVAAAEGALVAHGRPVPGSLPAYEATGAPLPA